jgi:hypothetical protein
VLTVSFNSATAGSATISVTAQNDDGVSISNALSVSTYAEYVTETDPNATVSISVADGATPSVIHFENADATVALTIGSGAAAVDLAMIGTFDLSVQSTSSGPFALLLTGEGDFSVAGWTDLPSGSTFEIDGGTVHFTDDLASEGANLAVTVDNGGDLSFESTQHLASLTLAEGTATLAEGTDKVLVLGALSINLDSAWLDLQNNGLIVNYSGTSPLATLTGYIASAYTTGGATHWQGTASR